MQIEYNGQTLSDGGTDGPQTIRTAPSRIVDSSAPLRADFALRTDRQGKSNVLAWTQQRTHASITAARLYLFTHLAGLPDGRHTATITTEDATVHLLSNAVLIPGQASQIGTVTTHDYELRGGAISGDTPEPLPPRTPSDPNTVTHGGVTVTHNGEAVTHS